MSTELALPATGDQRKWTDQERAIVEAAGLVRVVDKRTGEKVLADRPTVEAFLAHCRRTGLDPIARQIYAIYRGGKWGIQISIDGARLVADRTGQYEGQTPVQWTDDGVTWVEVWLKEEAPRAARVGVYRRGFREPLYAVATWDSYVVLEDEWDGPPGNRQKTGRQVVSSMWRKFGPLMLGKCAEMLALRKAFPQDLSGLYTTEEMGQAGQSAPTSSVPVQRVEEIVVDDRDRLAEIAATDDIEQVRNLYREAQRDGLLGLVLTGDGSEVTLEAALWARARELEAVPLKGVDEPEAPAERDWVAEARRLTSSKAVIDLSREALAKDAPQAVIDELADIAAELDTAEKQPESGGGWAQAAPVADEWEQEPTVEPESGEGAES